MGHEAEPGGGWPGGRRTLALPMSARRQVRLRKEFLYRKALEDRERAAADRKHRIRTAVEGTHHGPRLRPALAHTAYALGFQLERRFQPSYVTMRGS